MGLFGFGKKAAPTGPVSTTEELRARLLGLNRPTAPWQIVDGVSAGVDLIAEWRIVDAKWYEVFAKAGTQEIFRIYMKFDSAKNEVRAQDRRYSISWKAGVPSLSLSASAFVGQTTSVEFGAAYGFTEELAPGKIYKYRFSTGEIKKPIQKAIAASGWNFKGVAFGKL